MISDLSFLYSGKPLLSNEYLRIYVLFKGHCSAISPLLRHADLQTVLRWAHRVLQQGHPRPHHEQLLLDPRHIHRQGPRARHGNKDCFQNIQFQAEFIAHQRRPPTAEEIEYMRFYDHPGYIHPGIRTSDPRVNTRQYHVFYQWVSFLLFIQVSKNYVLL